MLQNKQLVENSFRPSLVTSLLGEAIHTSGKMMVGSLILQTPGAAFPNPLDASDLGGNNGPAINGLVVIDELSSSESNWSVSGAGNINDYGNDDVIIDGNLTAKVRNFSAQI